ncbi:MAG: hypothetical protein ACRENE_11155 [Polyangiaceae bacterium]
MRPVFVTGLLIFAACGTSQSSMAPAGVGPATISDIDAPGDDAPAADDAGTQCLTDCNPFEQVVLKLSCLAIVGAQTSGACSVGSCIDKVDGGSCAVDHVTVVPSAVGSCHLELTFLDGYQYGVDLTFASMTSSGACPCTSIGATNSLPAVDNPGTTCVVVGSADAGFDGADGASLEGSTDGAGG